MPAPSPAAAPAASTATPRGVAVGASVAGPALPPIARGARSLLDRFWRGVGVTLVLAAVDVVAFASLWLLAWELRADYIPIFRQPINEVIYYLRALLVVVPVWVAVSVLNGLYAHREKVSSLAETRALLGALKDGLFATFAVAFLLKEYDLGRSIVLMAAVFNFAWLFASRMALRELKRLALEQGYGLRRAVIVGAGQVAQRVVDRVVRHPEIGYALIGYVTDDDRMTGGEAGAAREGALVIPPRLDGRPNGHGAAGGPGGEAGGPAVLRRLGALDDLPRILRAEAIDEVFISAPHLSNNDVLNLVSRCEDAGARFNLCSNILEVITDRVKIDDIGDLPVIPFRGTRPAPLQSVAKRALDLVVAGGLLVVFAVPMAAIAALIRLTSGRPVFFSQTRIGQGGRPFTIHKFRTMTVETPTFAPAPVDAEDPRVTRVGRFLRKTSLDELPQLFNVLRGDMSMVGPRPEMPFIVERYEEWQRRRLDVKPGITGLWQIVGRKNLPLALNMEYDFFYIKNQSFLLDVLILLRTIPAVIFGRGAF